MEEQQEQSEQQPENNDNDKGKYRIWLYIIPIVILITWPVVKWVMKANSNDMRLSKDAYSAFNSQEGELQQENAAGKPAPELNERGLSVHYRTAEQEEAEDQRAAAARAKRAAEARQQADARAAFKAGAAAQAGITDAQKAHEQEFLRKHDAEIRNYQAYLDALGNKYKNAEVAKMDAEFAAMDRFMALKSQYAKDRDAYKWARGVIALPEVREAVLRYSSNAQVMGALMGAALEALKNPPPAAIYQEMLSFLGGDSQVAPYVQELAGGAAGNVAGTLPYALPPGTDITPLTNLGTQIAGGNRPPAKR